jgi:DNA repair exonuclease SbcCD ATPase subunit
MEPDINATLEWFGAPFWVESVAEKDSLGFLAHFSGAPPRPAERLSGGQSGVFAIGFRRAAQQVFNADIGTMWLDEPTAALDEENLTYFGEALQKLAAEVRNRRQLVIITHAGSLRSSFDQVIEVQ